MSPRPILKRPATIGAPHDHSPHPVVHFPPSPRLTTHTFSVYSASAYDRSPIIVAPNTCALPERGCPGRTYSLDDDPATSQTSRQRGRCYGSDEMHPRAFYGAPHSNSTAGTCGLPPPLIPDLSSSDSEESDEVASPPLDSSHVTIPSHLHSLAIPRDKYVARSLHGSYATSSPAISFSPSHPSRSPYPYRFSVPEDTQDQKPRHHRERKNEGSYDLGRIPSGQAANAQQCTMPKKSKKNRVSELSKSLPACHATSNFRVEDDGCLGGF